jgi:hypothetical protein
MKKGMRFITVLTLLFFAVSIGLVATAFSKAVNKNIATTTKPLPQTQTPAAAQPAKAEFWDLKVLRFVIKGETFPFANDYYKAKIINIKVGETVGCDCYYTVETIPVGGITTADVNKWGTGKLEYKIAGGLFFPGPPSHQEYQIVTHNLPKFTKADVETWKTTLGTSNKKVYTNSLKYNWTAKPEHVGKSMYLHFDVDSFFSIKETDEQNNGSFSGNGLVAKFVVTP